MRHKDTVVVAMVVVVVAVVRVALLKVGGSEAGML